MRFSYRVERHASGILVECLEADAIGEGSTEDEAVASLRAALEERMLRPDAVAPPSQETSCTIELVAAERC
jgi:hypothetical protein